jgi:imidazolonepropionase-like amidohydrolase
MVRPVARSQEERMSELLLRGGRPWRFAGPADVLVRDGVIARIEPDIDAPGAEVFDVSGRLVLPGLVEAHCHLDKTLYGRRGNRTRPATRSPTGSATSADDAASSACPTPTVPPRCWSGW